MLKEKSSKPEKEIIESLFEMAKGNESLEMMIDMAVSAKGMVEDVIDCPQNPWDRCAPVTKMIIRGDEYEVQLHLVKDKGHWLKGEEMIEKNQINGES